MNTPRRKSSVKSGNVSYLFLLILHLHYIMKRLDNEIRSEIIIFKQYFPYSLLSNLEKNDTGIEFKCVIISIAIINLPYLNA